MRKSDAWTIENRISSKELMRRAGAAIFEAGDWKAPVAVVCGKGNNAGDGYVAAELFKRNGIDCTVINVFDTFSGDGQYYYDICRECGVKIERYSDKTDFSAYGSILDCLLGTGFKGDVAGVMKEVIEKINTSGAYIVAADINSGLNGDSGCGSTYVKSDLTVSIGSYKHGHFRGNAADAMKTKVNADIGIEIQEPGPVVITCAMEDEFLKLAERLENREEHITGNYRFVKGEIDNYPVVVVRSLMGMVNAAAVAVLAITGYSPVCYIVQGLAGGHNPELSQGDIILGREIVDYGSYYSWHRDSGQGSDFKKWSYVGEEILKDGRVERALKIESSRELIELAESVEYSHGRIIPGVIGTADAWNREIDVINFLHEKFGTDCEEMEGFAAANICRQFGVPFIDIRIISNSELFPEHEFSEVYGYYCQEYVFDFVRKIISTEKNKNKSL